MTCLSFFFAIFQQPVVNIFYEAQSMFDYGKKGKPDSFANIHQCHYHIFKEGRTQHKWDEGIENFSKGTASFDYYYTLIKLSLNTKQGAMLIATCCSLIFNELSALGYIKYTLITYNNHFAGAITANKKIILKDVPNTRFAYNLYIH